MKIDYSRSIIEIIFSHEAISPDRPGLIFDLDQGRPDILTYSQVAAQVRHLTGAIIDRGLSGRQVALLFAPGLEFPLAMLACLAAGAIAVPLAPVGRRRARLQNITALMAQLRPDCLLVDASMAGLFGDELAIELDGSGIDYLTYDDLDAVGSPASPVKVAPSDLAVLQYTSGTTASPKGVMITHGNIVANEQMIEVAFGHDRDSHFVGWLPHYHDQGLFGNILQPLYLGTTCVLTSPAAFIGKPMTWLNLISRYRAHTSGGPNFGFDLCADYALRRGVPEGLDLSCWKVAFNGAERVRPKTMERFVQCFEDVGFEERAFMPCYGLAECTLAAGAVAKYALPEVRSFDSDALSRGIAQETLPASTSIDLACCGPTIVGSETVIVDTETRQVCADGEIGEIWTRGPHVGAGYFGNPEATEQTFRAFLASGEGPFMRTGDLAFAMPEGLYLVGRSKDLIIVRGRNFAPSDVEHIWFELSGTLGQATAAAVQVEIGEKQHVVLFAELKRVEARGLTERGVDEMANTLRAAVMERLELAVTDLVVVAEGTIPRTTSGKVQRKRVGQMLVDHELPFLAISGPLAKVLTPQRAPAED